MKALIDGDIVAVRCAATAENDEVWIACARAKELIEQILHDTESSSFEIWLSGKNNFRYAVYPEYKANRLGMKRPKWEKDVKEYLKIDWGAMESDGCEADDMLGSRQTDNTIISTLDKDLRQIKGWHYNFVKKEKYYITPEEADRFFYYQMLVGDPTDNIKGVKGIGKVTTEQLLADTPREQWRDMVQEKYGSEEEFDLNAQCLYIWRKDKDHYSTITTGARGSVNGTDEQVDELHRATTS